MKFSLSTVILFLVTLTSAQANDPHEGYAIVRSDTIYGQVKINFEAGSITIRQGSVNRMFVSGIERVTILNKQRDTYLLRHKEEKATFFKVLVEGDYPLLENDGSYFTMTAEHVIEIRSEKELYSLFGKRPVKDYLFIRNIAIKEKSGLVDVFGHFNTHSSF